MVETDDGYADFGIPDVRCHLRKMETNVSGAAHGQARARHEAIHGRFKGFNILRDEFCHDITLHGMVVRAVAVIVQVQMEHSHPIFQVNYPILGTF